MRIQSKSQSIENVASSNIVKQQNTIQTISKQPEQASMNNQLLQAEEQDNSQEKLQKAVNSVNEIFEINHSASKFVLHKELDRYYVQLIDKETEEVVKEIPSKKLLDAFYEMQKLIGMIVDEKI